MADPTPAAAPGQHRRRNEAFVHGLRHERDHWTSAARRPRRPQAGAPPRPVRHEDDGAVGDARLPQVREDRRRGDGQFPPARRRVDLRHARPHGAGLQHALSAGGRAGELRLDRRRPARGDAVHRSAAEGARRRHDGGSRQGDRRLHAQLRRDDRRADGAAGAVSEPAGQRFGGHRGGHGDQRAAAQPARGRRRLHLAHRADAPGRARRGGGALARREAEAAAAPHPRPRLPDRRLHRRARRNPAGLHDRPRLDPDAGAIDDRDEQEGRQGLDRRSPRFRTR